MICTYLGVCMSVCVDTYHKHINMYNIFVSSAGRCALTLPCISVVCVGVLRIFLLTYLADILCSDIRYSDMSVCVSSVYLSVRPASAARAECERQERGDQRVLHQPHRRQVRRTGPFKFQNSIQNLVDIQNSNLQRKFFEKDE